MIDKPCPKTSYVMQGCGIVEFETAQEAADAINTLHDSQVMIL